MTRPFFHARGLRRDQLGPLDLDLATGECLCVTGPSGAGKTMLLRSLADLDPHEGEVTLDGASQASIAPAEWRRRVALLPAESRWWAPRVADHFPRGLAANLEAVGFGDGVGAWEIARLSSGERQRIALLRVLALEPEVLLLDEPTANLDDANAARVESMLGEWCRHGRRALVWVSHDRAQVARVCVRHLTMEAGRWAA